MTSADFTHAQHTIVVSDIHLSDAEPVRPGNSLWKRFKRPKYFVDRTFKTFLDHLSSTISSPIELILNGDIFDFDSVMRLPNDSSVRVDWLERRRGLYSEEAKSRFKLQVILSDHPVWVDAIRSFILKGNRVVFVIGNHDMELHWPGVQSDLLARLDLPEQFISHVRICEWFYVSNQDTLIEHGNQYDAYCLAFNPINPLIKKGGRVLVRLPFGNLAGKFMLNGMGLMNPHVDSSYIKSSFRDYLIFYYRYVMRTQPFLLGTWFWSALATLVYSVTEGLLPSMTDPMTIGARVENIAAKSNSSSRVIWSLRELQVHPAVLNPIKLLKELWLDRAILFILMVFGSFQIFSLFNVFVTISVGWFIALVLVMMPVFIFYARSVESSVPSEFRRGFEITPRAAEIAGVKRVIQGHTHRQEHSWIEGVEYLNTGTWSPAFHDVECTRPYGNKCFAWIKPSQENPSQRIAELLEWKESEAERLQITMNPERGTPH